MILPTVSDRWKIRRKMALGAYVAGFAYPVLVVATKSQQLADISMHFYAFLAVILTNYYGFATADDAWQKEKKE